MGRGLRPGPIFLAIEYKHEYDQSIEENPELEVNP
jgi:hypothetical protein